MSQNLNDVVRRYLCLFRELKKIFGQLSFAVVFLGQMVLIFWLFF